MNHREKLRLARREGGIPPRGFSIFDTSYWQSRAMYRRLRVKRRENPALMKSLGL